MAGREQFKPNSIQTQLQKIRGPHVTKYAGLIVAIFGGIGLGIGLGGYAGVDFAQQQFVNSAEGEFMRGLGQLFVGVIFFQTAFVTLMLGGVVGAFGGCLRVVNSGSE